MASIEIEREIDKWVERCPLKGRKPLSDRRAIVDNNKHYEQIWRKCLKEMSENKNILII